MAALYCSAIDPTLGRIALPLGLPAATKVRVDCYYGFSADTAQPAVLRNAAGNRQSPAPCSSRQPGPTATQVSAITA
jgi:hypothetical protein